MGTTKIKWTDSTWSPVTGCTKIAEGCKNCYAERMTRRFWKQWNCPPPPNHFAVRSHPERLELPYRWRKPRMIFVCSMSDLFHPNVPVGCQLGVYETITDDRGVHHTYQILTKRPELMEQFHHREVVGALPNLWLGVSCSTQKDLTRDLPILVRIPAAVRFVSLEPLLERVTLPSFGADWVIVGSESGPKRRPCEIAWIRDVVWQCRDKKLPIFVKQMEINGKVTANPDDWPEDLRIQEFPK